MEKYIYRRLEIDLSVDQKTGEPIIKIRHHDKANDLEQLVLGIFVKGAKERGLKISNPSGLGSTSGESHENYVISLNPKTE
jgi:hypothetical protein